MGRHAGIVAFSYNNWNDFRVGKVEDRRRVIVTELFREISPKIADRPGGYLRILKTGKRLGDNAEMCIVEEVVEAPVQEEILAVEEAPETNEEKKEE